jgi:hypothetical protein
VPAITVWDSEEMFVTRLSFSALCSIKIETASLSRAKPDVSLQLLVNTLFIMNDFGHDNGGTAINKHPYINARGARSSVVVKALCYKPEGRGFNSR